MINELYIPTLAGEIERNCMIKYGNCEMRTLNDDKGYDKNGNCQTKTLDDDKCYLNCKIMHL